MQKNGFSVLTCDRTTISRLSRGDESIGNLGQKVESERTRKRSDQRSDNIGKSQQPAEAFRLILAGFPTFSVAESELQIFQTDFFLSTILVYPLTFPRLHPPALELKIAGTSGAPSAATIAA